MRTVSTLLLAITCQALPAADVPVPQTNSWLALQRASVMVSELVLVSAVIYACR